MKDFVEDTSINHTTGPSSKTMFKPQHMLLGVSCAVVSTLLRVRGLVLMGTGNSTAKPLILDLVADLLNVLRVETSFMNRCTAIANLMCSMSGQDHVELRRSLGCNIEANRIAVRRLGDARRSYLSGTLRGGLNNLSRIYGCELDSFNARSARCFFQTNVIMGEAPLKEILRQQTYITNAKNKTKKHPIAPGMLLNTKINSTGRKKDKTERGADGG